MSHKKRQYNRGHAGVYLGVTNPVNNDSIQFKSWRFDSDSDSAWNTRILKVKQLNDILFYLYTRAFFEIRIQFVGIEESS